MTLVGCTRSSTSPTVGEQPRGELIERLVRRHHVEVEVRDHLGQLENLVEQLPMLRRRTYRDVNILLGLEPVDDRKQLDRFRTSAQQNEKMLPHVLASNRAGSGWKQAI